MPSSIRFSPPSPLALVLLGGLVMGAALGIRHAQGLFMLPLAANLGAGRADVAFALALQNLVWGVAQPLAGWIADRHGSRRLIFGGCLLYGLGLAVTAHAATTLQLVLGAGLVIGVALACTAFGAIYGALGRMLAPEQRGWGLGLAGAAAGVGQFASIPAAQGAVGTFGVSGALLLLAAGIAMLCVCALALDDRHVPGQRAAISDQPLAPVLRAAARRPGFWMLGAGFFACGFQLAFIATHLPAWLLERGMGGRHAAIALSLVALANVGGTYLCSVLGARLRKGRVLAVIYLVRSLAIALFVLAPPGAATLYAFAVVMGVLWLGTVPLTNGIVSGVFGTRYLATMFGLVFLGHQAGSFCGVWLGGLVFDATGSYDLVWCATVAIGLAAAALHWPLSEAPAAISLRPA